jgi:hypothetical protein
MNRRYFFRSLASGLVAATAPQLFLPKLIKPAWKPLQSGLRVNPWSQDSFEQAIRSYEIFMQDRWLTLVRRSTLYIAKEAITPSLQLIGW